MKKEPKVEDAQIAILRDGLRGPFWRTIKSIVENEKDDLELDIMENEEISDKQRDELRRWRNFLVYFISLPEKCIESIEKRPINDGTEGENEQDPYEQPLSEIRTKIKNGK